MDLEPLGKDLLLQKINETSYTGSLMNVEKVSNTIKCKVIARSKLHDKFTINVGDTVLIEKNLKRGRHDPIKYSGKEYYIVGEEKILGICE